LTIIGTLGIGGAVAAFVFFPAVAAPIISAVTCGVLGCKPCLVAALLILVALASFWYGRAGQYERGHAAAIAEIAAEDSHTIARALEKRGEWQKCRTGGGTWDQTTGACK
jgi:hypothetical protein